MTGPGGAAEAVRPAAGDAHAREPVPATARWPLARLPALLQELARALAAPVAGAGDDRGPEAAPELPADVADPQALARHLLDWLPHGARAEGLEAEPLLAAERVALPAPAPGEALLLTDAARTQVIAVVRVRARAALLLGRAGRLVAVPRAALEAFVATGEAASAARALGRKLSALGLPPARARRAAGALLGDGAPGGAGHRVAVRAPSLTARLRARGARGLLARLVLGTLAQWLLVLVAVALLGRGALAGRLDGSWLWGFCLLLGSAALARALADLAAADLGTLAGALGRDHLLSAMLRLDPESLRAQGSGQLLGRVLDIDALEAIARGGAGMAVLALVELALAAVVLGLGAAGAAHLVALLGGVALLGLGFSRMLAATRAWLGQRLALTHALVEQMVGHRTRTVQGTPGAEAAADEERLARYEAACARSDALVARLQTLLPRGFVVVALALLAPAYARGAEPGALATSLGGLLLGFNAFSHLGAVLAQAALGWVTWQRLRELTGAAAPAPPRAWPGLPAPASGPAPLLVVRGLSYRYPGRSEPVLRDCTLTVRPGERILLHGDSGSGKSTLAGVLGGLRAPDAGLLMLGGLDRHSLGEAAWRRRVALVPQFHDNHVFSGSLLYNLLLGRRWPPEPDDVRAAEELCQALGLGELLSRMPAGLQQMLGESGWQLSHGERSRVCLARALLQERDLRLFDESFTALDPWTARAILPEALARAGTVVVVAHV